LEVSLSVFVSRERRVSLFLLTYIALANLSHFTPTDTFFVARVHDWPRTTWCLDSDAGWGNATDRVSVLEIDKSMEFNGDPRIPPCHPLDPHRIWRSLQRHYRLLTRLLVV